jgi:hypothetical protein
MQVIAPILIIYREVRRARGAATELSKNYDMTKPKLGLQINTAGCYGLVLGTADPQSEGWTARSIHLHTQRTHSVTSQ